MNSITRYSKRFFPGIIIFSIFLVVACSNKNNIENTTTPKAADAGDVQIKLDSTAQVIRGFGAANIVNWVPDMTDNEITEAFSKGQGQLGFSILRIRIPPTKGEWNAYVPTAKKAYDMGVKIIASPWSPPASLKTNDNTTGGSLSDTAYADYAHWLHSFVDFMASNGVPLYAVSVQNEPDIKVNYESCDWTPDQMLKFVREYGDSLGTKLMAPESFQFRRQMSDPLLNDSTAAAHLNIVAGHIYGGGLAPYPLAEEKGKEVWITEHFTDSKDPGNVWPLSLDVGTEIQKVMKDDMNAYVWWYIVRFYGPIGDGTNGTTAGRITKRGYVMSQFSRFIRPGFVRVAASEPSQGGNTGISVTAYKDPTNQSVVIVAENPDPSPQKVTFKINGTVPGSFQPYVTSEKQNAEKGTVIQVSGSDFNATLPEESITTFVSD